jgi:hypothetical protein
VALEGGDDGSTVSVLWHLEGVLPLARWDVADAPADVHRAGQVAIVPHVADQGQWARQGPHVREEGVEGGLVRHRATR